MESLKGQSLVLSFFFFILMIFPMFQRFYPSTCLLMTQTSILTHQTHLQKTMNKHLRYVKKWLDANKLPLNLDKTNFVLFHSPQVSITEPITLKFGKTQQHQENVKFLGVLLDEHLTWKYHITELSRKLARVSGVFLR